MGKILLLLTTTLIAGIVFYYFYIGKPHQEARKEQTSYELNASELYGAFEENEERANEKYLDKIITVTGQVGEILRDKQGKDVLILKNEDDLFGVKCNIAPEDSVRASKVEEGNIVTLKCICKGGEGGFDVEMVQCRFQGEQK